MIDRVFRLSLMILPLFVDGGGDHTQENLIMMNISSSFPFISLSLTLTLFDTHIFVGKESDTEVGRFKAWKSEIDYFEMVRAPDAFEVTQKLNTMMQVRFTKLYIEGLLFCINTS